MSQIELLPSVSDSVAAGTNSCSILEAFDVEKLTGKKMSYEYIDKNREG